jgi:uncharacterized MAPEG superfamily protein
MIFAAFALRARAWTPAGMNVGFGNREALPDPTPLSARADRAAKNMIENFPLFIALVLALRISGRGETGPDPAASLFFWARAAYWPLYLAGVPYARTFVWGLSVAGLVWIGARALG